MYVCIYIYIYIVHSACGRPGHDRMQSCDGVSVLPSHTWEPRFTATRCVVRRPATIDVDMIVCYCCVLCVRVILCVVVCRMFIMLHFDRHATYIYIYIYVHTHTYIHIHIKVCNKDYDNITSYHVSHYSTDLTGDPRRARRAWC